MKKEEHDAPRQAHKADPKLASCEIRIVAHDKAECATVAKRFIAAGAKAARATTSTWTNLFCMACLQNRTS